MWAGGSLVEAEGGEVKRSVAYSGWRRFPTVRQRRLCQRSGHRWGMWYYSSFYAHTMTVAFGDAPPVLSERRAERHEVRHCYRCRDSQYRNVKVGRAIGDAPLEMEAL